MACRTSSSAREGSAISPLRTPRDRAWPRPTMFSEPSALRSPTTAQTFEVPTSNPTIMEEGSNMLFLEVNRFGRPGRERGGRIGFEPARRHAVGDGQVKGCDGLVQLLAEIMDATPAPELALQIS